MKGTLCDEVDALNGVVLFHKSWLASISSESMWVSSRRLFSAPYLQTAHSSLREAARKLDASIQCLLFGLV